MWMYYSVRLDIIITHRAAQIFSFFSAGHFITVSPSLLLLQPTSRSCTVVLSTLSRRRCPLWAPSTHRTPISMESSTQTCVCTTGALHLIWMTTCPSSGPAFWSEPLSPLPLQTWVLTYTYIIHPNILITTSYWIIPGSKSIFKKLNWHSWSYVSCSSLLQQWDKLITFPFLDTSLRLDFAFLITCKHSYSPDGEETYFLKKPFNSLLCLPLSPPCHRSPYRRTTLNVLLSSRRHCGHLETSLGTWRRRWSGLLSQPDLLPRAWWWAEMLSRGCRRWAVCPSVYLSLFEG